MSVKIKQLKKSINTGGINEMFDKMMGIKEADPAVIRPKFVKILNLLRKFYKVMNLFAGMKTLRVDFPHITQDLDEVLDFINKLRDNIKFDPAVEETEEKYTKLSLEDMNTIYRKLKEDEDIKLLIVLCGKLKRYKSYLDDKDNLKDNFIGQEPGLSLKIFPFSNFDLKILWANAKMTPTIKKYILSILHNVWKTLFEMYRIITSPDVDIKQFSELLLNAIQKIKKEPELSRCKNAFRRIESSVTLLENNFDGYYRESVASNNPNIIMESFIIDVSNQGGASASLTREFRKIIMYMQKLGNKNGRAKDPRVKQLFKMLNNNFELMEKHSKEEPEEKDAPDDTTNEEPVHTSSHTPVQAYVPGPSKTKGKKKKSKKKKK